MSDISNVKPRKFAGDPSPKEDVGKEAVKEDPNQAAHQGRKPKTEEKPNE
jgi:hypothetical protein